MAPRRLSTLGTERIPLPYRLPIPARDEAGRAETVERFPAVPLLPENFVAGSHEARDIPPAGRGLTKFGDRVGRNSHDRDRCRRRFEGPRQSARCHEYEVGLEPGHFAGEILVSLGPPFS